MFLVPENNGRKVNARFMVSEVPATETLDPLPFTMHWLFCWLPLPGAMVPTGNAPVSVSSASVFRVRSYTTWQPETADEDALNNAETVLKSVAPAPSEN